MRIFLLTIAVILGSMIVPSVKAVDGSLIQANSKEWLSHGFNYAETRHSPLEQIDRQNVSNLDLFWSFDFETARGMEATPIIHNGVLYVSTGWSHVYAIDARSGQQIWHFDAQVDKSMLVKTCCGPVNRGVAIWRASEDAPLQVFFGALDGRLISLDAISGEQIWSTQTTPTDGNYSITGAPRIVDGLVIIGNGGAELGVRGFVAAYDAQTGERVWRFYTVPGDPNKPQENSGLDKAVTTWSGNYWYQQGGGGGTVWDSMAYDPELGLLYIGTGNGSPWNRDIRSPGGGDNLYLSSIVALNVKSGEYVWHYQTTPAENWDYTATQHIILADIDWHGETRKVLMQAPKNGFFYTLDRTTGELLAADAYTHVTWASKIDLKSGRPVETEYAKYQENGGSILWPAPFGGHNWPPMSYSDKTGLVYIPVQDIPGYYSAVDKVTYGVGRWNTGVDLNDNRHPSSWVSAKAMVDALMTGQLVAWDPKLKKRVWEVDHPTSANGGILSTAGGLVFQGATQSNRQGIFAAYNAETGDKLWQYQSDSAVLAGPTSYELDGEQYIAVTQGSGGAVMLAVGDQHKRNQVNRNKLLVFKLGKFNQTKQLEDQGYVNVLALGHEINASEEQIEHGAQVFERNCAVCHGISAKGNGVVPDLRYMSEKTHTDFIAIAFGGALSHKGMVGYYKSLNIDDINAIHAYLDTEQQALNNAQEMTLFQKIEYWAVYWGAKLGKHFPSIANASRPYLL